MTADLGDTSRCPPGVRCEACGLEAGSTLRVYTIACPLGVMCLTMCPRCGRASPETTRRSISAPTEARLVMQQAGHIGVTVADMRMLQTDHDRSSS